MRNTGDALTTPELLAKFLALHAELAVVLDESRMLCARGLQLALAAYPRIWPIGGGSDIELVTAMLTDVALCLPCLSRKAGISVDDVNAVLMVIVKTIRVAVGPRRCDTCLERKTTFGIKVDGQP